MKPLTSKSVGEMQYEDYYIQFVGIIRSEVLSCENIGLMKATQKVVSTNYLRLERKLKKKEVELVNVKSTTERHQVEIKEKNSKVAHLNYAQEQKREIAVTSNSTNG